MIIIIIFFFITTGELVNRFTRSPERVVQEESTRFRFLYHHSRQIQFLIRSFSGNNTSISTLILIIKLLMSCGYQV